MSLFKIVTAESRLQTEARSSLHPIHGQAVGLVGEADVVVKNGRFDLEETNPSGRLVLPVEGLRSGNPLQDFEMMRRIDARKFPEIEALLRRVTPKGGDSYRIEADLTFHGVTRRIAVDATARLEANGRALLESDFRLDVTVFEVKPPNILGLKVHPDVTVRVRLVLAPD